MCIQKKWSLSMHYAISTKVLGQTHMWNVLKHIRSNFWIFHFLRVFGFLQIQKQKHKSMIKCKNNAYKEMHDAQMHDNEASNAWKVLQRSKELDQGPKEHKLNHRNPCLSKWNNCLEWVSYEKWDDGWKNENRRCT